ncbi:MAG: response regulator transcription factor [Dehalococcoidia bacterium]
MASMSTGQTLTAHGPDVPGEGAPVLTMLPMTEGIAAGSLTVLLVEPRAALSGAIAAALQPFGQRVLAVRTVEDGVALSQVIHFDAVIARLDRARMEDEPLGALLEAGRPPLIVLADGDLPEDAVNTLRASAGDVLTMPVETDDLADRIAALSKGARPERRARVLHGPSEIALYPTLNLVRVGEVEVPLKPKAFGVLRALLERRGHVLSADDLSLAVWGYRTFASRNFVESQISSLRAALAGAGAYDVVRTVRAAGYVIR